MDQVIELRIEIVLKVYLEIDINLNYFIINLRHGLEKSEE